jgi:hypothetical protein
MNIIAIFDNGGKTLDRFTVVLNNQDGSSNNYEMLGVSKGATGFHNSHMAHTNQKKIIPI